MFIEFGLEKNATKKQKGDLLENLAKQVLENQFYNVEKEVRRTGMELDLLCVHKSNLNKKIYVECKAYGKNNLVQSDVIKQLVGTINIEDDINEGWLIATGELGKDAKGLRDKIINQQNTSNIVIYTVDEIVELFVKSGVIFDYKLIELKLKEHNIINNKNINIKEIGILITEFNYFYVVIIEENSSLKGVILFYAKNKDVEIVREMELLRQINELECFISKENLDIFYIRKYLKIKNKSLNLNGVYLEQINSLDINIQHSSKNELKLDDLFVYPDLNILNENEKDIINSREIISYNKCLIFGDDISGKTSLAYVLQKDLNNIGNIPIYINAKDIKNVKKDKFINLLYRKFKKQYYELEKEEFNEIINEKKENFALIIDDFHNISIKRDLDKIKFIEILNKEFQKIYIFANSKIELEIMNRPEYKNEVFSEYTIFKIKELGYLKRDELIEKWILINNELEDNEVYERKDYISQFLTTISKNKYIATYPLYVLILLQQLEAGKNSVSGNSYVEFYRFLINQSLNSLNIKPEEFEFYHSYLSFFAYKFFISFKKEFNEEELLEFHKEFSRIYHKTSFRLDILLKAKIFKEDNGYYKFSHNYIYYFFISKYLSDNLTKKRKKEEIKSYIDKILNNLHLEEYANIIVFFIHHSQNASEYIIEKIISQGDSLFKEIDFFKMSDDELININKLIEREAEIFIEDKHPDKYRKEILAKRDEVKNLQQFEELNMDKESLDMFAKINLSFKIVEILSQVLKNYYASYSYEEKKEIIERILKLGLKNLNWFFIQLSEISNILQKDIEREIDNKDLSEREILNIIKKIVFKFTELVIFIFTKKIADSLSNKNILDSLKLVTNENNDILSFKIIDLEANLNFPNKLNIEEIENLYKKLDNNYIAKDIIRYLVIEHLYKFKIPIFQKQSICKKLNINLKYIQNHSMKE